MRDGHGFATAQLFFKNQDILHGMSCVSGVGAIFLLLNTYTSVWCQSEVDRVDQGYGVAHYHGSGGRSKNTSWPTVEGRRKWHLQNLRGSPWSFFVSPYGYRGGTAPGWRHGVASIQDFPSQGVAEGDWLLNLMRTWVGAPTWERIGWRMRMQMRDGAQTRGGLETCFHCWTLSVKMRGEMRYR